LRIYFNSKESFMSTRIARMSCQSCGSTEWKDGHVSDVFRCSRCHQEVQRLKRQHARKHFDSAPGVLVHPSQLSFNQRELAQPQVAL
jgi:hypothetical protein